MKDYKSKPEMFNSYQIDSSVVNVNEFSTIPLDVVSEMVMVDFPLRYNSVRVTITCKSSSLLDNVVKDFVVYSQKVFSVVLVQSALLERYVFSIFSRDSLSRIECKLRSFVRTYVDNSLIDFEY